MAEMMVDVTREESLRSNITFCAECAGNDQGVLYCGETAAMLEPSEGDWTAAASEIDSVSMAVGPGGAGFEDCVSRCLEECAMTTSGSSRQEVHENSTLDELGTILIDNGEETECFADCVTTCRKGHFSSDPIEEDGSSSRTVGKEQCEITCEPVEEGGICEGWLTPEPIERPHGQRTFYVSEEPWGIGHKSTSEFLNTIHGERELEVNIIGATIAETRLILAVWSILLENQDIAIWAIEYVTGEDGRPLVELLENYLTEVEFNDSAEMSGWAPWRGWATDLAAHVGIGREPDTYRDSLRAFICEHSSTNDLECAIFDLSQVVFHELYHNVYSGQQEQSGCCHAVTLCTNTFFWGLLSRYSDVLSSQSCSKWSGKIDGRPCNDALFFNRYNRSADPFMCMTAIDCRGCE